MILLFYFILILLSNTFIACYLFMINNCKYDIVFVQFFTMFPIRFFYNRTYNWSIGFLQIVNVSKLYHMLVSNHSTFYVQSFQVSFLYKFLVLKMQTLLFTQNV
jgi:hypothetical protein